MAGFTRYVPKTRVILMLVASLFWILAPEVVAQNGFELPDVLPDNVNTEEGDPVSVIVSVVKLVVALVLWIAVALLAAKTILEAVKDIRDARDGDTKWVSAGKSIVGGILFFVLILALALWIQNSFLS